MRKLLLVVALAVGFFGVTNVTHAAAWKDDNNQPIKAGNCTLVNTKSEADVSHVYTLNPDNARQIGYAYFNYWGREARCDEIQFHVDHNTSIARLQKWLSDVVLDWYKHIGTTHLRNTTVSTSRYEWFYIDNTGTMHRIPDWLTGLSWGLLIGDRYSVPPGLTEAFYKYVKLGAPLQFSQGQYHSSITEIWRASGNTDLVPSLPARLAGEIQNIKSYVFSDCNPYFDSHSAYANLLDWRWKRLNPICTD